MSITHRIETVTPEMAAKWIDKNGVNRKVIQSVVDLYASDMKNGRFLMAGEPVQFGASGRLLNGQHRLWASIQSDCSFQALVVRGIENEEEVMRVIDSGKKRTLAHALEINGMGSATLLAAIINTCWRYDKHRLMAPEYPSHAEAFAWYETHSEVREAVTVSYAVTRQIKLPPSVVGAAYYINAQVDPEAAEQFWVYAGSGEGLEGGDPILAYRRWIIGQIRDPKAPTPKVHLAYALKAMNAWRDGRSTRLLIWRTSEGMPERWDSTQPARKSRRG